MTTNCSTARLPRACDPQLRLALQRADGRRISLPHAQPFDIGSARTCDLRLSDRFASCHHARIVHTRHGYRIEDLGSSNGTAVDGVPVGHAILEPGMKIEIGGTAMTVTRIDKPVDEVRPRRTRAPLVPVREQAALEPSRPGSGKLGQSRSGSRSRAKAGPAHTLLGPSKPMRALRCELEKLAAVSLPVLLRGETGTGKELAAQTLHAFGLQPGAPFVALNCGAVPAGLFESELFGHRRGAFTGAHRDHEGAFVRAKRGTVFLDEVGELPLAAQAKLLRVLETRRLTPVGASAEVEIHCRIVAATHRDLVTMVERGEFREDLFHRLGVVQVDLPPLRQRRADITALLERFVDEASVELAREVVLSQAAAAAALSHTWPGNVRELRNAVLRAAALSDGPISPAQLLPAKRRPRRGDLIAVPRGNYAAMQAALVQTVVAEEGSIRQAARVLDVPRSTLGAWMRRFSAEGLEVVVPEPGR